MEIGEVCVVAKPKKTRHAALNDFNIGDNSVGNLR